MPLFTPGLPIRKTVELTKTLRARDTPLPSLLPLAKETANPDYTAYNLYFPQRHEWLLEWIVQRMAEDKGEPAQEARTSPEFWTFMLELLRETPPAVIITVLRRHGLLETVLKAFKEAAEVEEKVYSTPREVASPASTMDVDIDEVKTSDKTTQLLESVTAVVVYLKQLGNKESLVAGMLRVKPTVGAEILATYLRLAKNLIARAEPIKDIWTEAMVLVWKGCIWGNPDIEKISAVWTGACLLDAAPLLSTSGISLHLKISLESMIGEYVFPAVVLYRPVNGPRSTTTKPSAEKLASLLAPLKSYSNPTGSMPSFLPELFRIGVQAQVKRRNSRPDVLVVDVIFQTLLSATIPDDSPVRGDVVAALLDILVQQTATLPTSTLLELTKTTAQLQSAKPNWSVVEMVLKLDFDAILGSDTQITDGLFTALSSAGDESQHFWSVLELVIDAFVTGRDLSSFVERWQSQLTISGTKKQSIWKTDRLAGIFAKAVETSFTPFQIERIVKKLVEDDDWVVLDAVLRGVSREETITCLENGALSRVADAARLQKSNWRAWRSLVRVGETKPQLLVPVIAKAAEVIEAKRWQEAVFAAEVLMRLAEVEDTKLLEHVEKVFRKATKSLKKRHDWNGSIDEVSGKTFGIAVATGIVARYLALLEHVDAETRQNFVNALLDAALKPSSTTLVSAQSLWRSMLQMDGFYECPRLKDTTLTALLNHLSPWPDMTADIPAALKKLKSSDASSISAGEIQINFLLESFLAFPLEALKRHIREKLLDTLFLMDQSHIPSARAVIERLWAVGNASSYMATVPEALKLWFKNDAIYSSELTARRILQHAFETKTQDKSRSYLQGALAVGNHILAKPEKAAKHTENLELCYVLITEFWGIREDSAVNQHQVIEGLRTQFLNAIEKALPEDIGHADVQLLRWWRTVWTLDREDATLKEGATQLALRIAAAAVPLLKTATTSIDAQRALQEAVEFVCTVADTADAATDATALAFVVLERGVAEGGREQILSQYTDMAARLSTAHFYLSLLRVLDSCLSEEELGDSIWPLLEAYIKMIKKPNKEELPDTLNTLSYVYNKLALSLNSSRSVAAFLTTASCLELLLRDAPWCLTQHCIDITPSSISKSLSPFGGPSFQAPNPDAIYTALTSLLSCILAVHRHRIRERHHLIVFSLQTMLSALFPPPIARRKTEAPTHPPWLLPSSSSSSPPSADSLAASFASSLSLSSYLSPPPPPVPKLTYVSARAFARVLGTFCEPPTSTVRARSAARVDLTNSRTAREKEDVAIVIGNVLECYVKCTLERSMDSAVREEVRLGMGAVLGVLKRDGVARVSARVDVPARAVIRGLWKDWTEEKGEMV